jgi:cytochrome o ubiquinol oxidase subunit IV
MYRDVSFRLTGFIASLLLTLAAYFIIVNPEYFNIKTAVMVIFVLAIFQSLIQLIFFINVWKEKGPLWNLSVFVSTVSIIFVVIFFSIWIINHLNYNMR